MTTSIDTNSFPSFKYLPHIPTSNLTSTNGDTTFPLQVRSHGRLWNILSFFIQHSQRLLRNIKLCFHKLQKYLSFVPARGKLQIPIKKRSIPQDIYQLFRHPINYELFRNQILSYKRKSHLYYRNYAFNSYPSSLNKKLNELNDYITHEKHELKVSIASYDAIVNEYVRKFLKNQPNMGEAYYLPALRFTALCIAIKISFDEVIYNSEFQQFLPKPFSISIHNAMEREFLKKIDWNMSCDLTSSSDIYGAYHDFNQPVSKVSTQS